MECPYCREEIADGAKKCRYCNEFLDKDADTHPSLLGQIDQISNILTDYVKKLIIWLFVGWCIWYLFPIVGTNTFSFDRGSKTGFDDSQNLSSKMTGEEKDLSKLHSILELQKEGWKFANKIPIEEFMEVYPNWNKMNGQARASALRVYGIQKNQ